MIFFVFFKDLNSFSACRTDTQEVCRNKCTNLNNLCKQTNKCFIDQFEKCISKRSNSTHCTIEYDSFGNLATNIDFPFSELFECNKTSCTVGQFFCTNLKFCISADLLCDGINHCYHNEDELGCGKTKVHFFTTKYL